jgi:hypothetical protein
MPAVGSDAWESFRKWFGARWRIVEPLPEMRPASAADSTEEASVLPTPPEGQEATARPASTELAASSLEEAGLEEAGLEEADSGEPPDFLVVGKLEDASKWAAGGFSVATALLVFFGVKDGVLDQAIRQEALATLCVFILLGVGVLSALFAGAIHPAIHIRLWAIIAAVTVMVSVTALYLPNLGGLGAGELTIEELPAGQGEGGLPGWAKVSLFILAGLFVAGAAVVLPLLVARLSSTARSLWPIVIVSGGGFILILLSALAAALISTERQTLLALLIGALFLTAIAWSFVRMAKVPAMAGIVILGVAATSLGLYGITKLSVQSKLRSIDPQVSASLEQSDGRNILKVVATVTRMRHSGLLITVNGETRIEEVQPREVMGATRQEIWQTVLEPNWLEEINTTISVPLVPSRWELVRVSYCQVDAPRLQECADQSEVLRVRNLMSEAGAEITGYIVATSAKSLKVALTGKNVASGNQIQAEICRVRKGGHTRQLAYATLTPDTSSAISWDVPVSAGADGDGLVLQYRRCLHGSCSGMTQIAKYTMP